MNEEFSDDEKAGFYKAIYSRRDVRSHFTAEPIDDKVLTKILNAAHHAPSVGFSQPWNFILIKSQETKNKIKKRLPSLTAQAGPGHSRAGLLSQKDELERTNRKDELKGQIRKHELKGRIRKNELNRTTYERTN